MYYVSTPQAYIHTPSYMCYIPHPQLTELIWAFLFPKFSHFSFTPIFFIEISFVLPPPQACLRYPARVAMTAPPVLMANASMWGVYTCSYTIPWGYIYLYTMYMYILLLYYSNIWFFLCMLGIDITCTYIIFVTLHFLHLLHYQGQCKSQALICSSSAYTGD